MTEQSKPALNVYHWCLYGLLIVLCFALEWMGDHGRELLRFQSDMIASGEWYRLLTGHFVHLGMNHLVLNMAGVVLFAYLFGRVLPLFELAITLLLYPLIISLGLWLEGSVYWYVGFSGVLYGLFALGVIRDPGATVTAKWVMVSLMLAKIFYDIFSGGDEALEDFTGGSVIALAHLNGVGLAVLHGVVYWGWVKFRYRKV